jgi:K+-transporting ATPase ATPase C chain
MKTLLSHLRGAVLGTLVLAAVTCGLYPLVVWGIAQAAFPHQANGSLIVDTNGTVRGSALLAQGFRSDRYFHPRPSAAGANGYDATSSGGSNLGPTSQKLRDQLQERITAYRAVNGLKQTDLGPADAVTASASGLDPQISVRNAELQAARVAKARGVAEEKVRELVVRFTDDPGLGILGDAGVRVLELNLALDALR